jgi:hypothetical protein
LKLRGATAIACFDSISRLSGDPMSSIMSFSKVSTSSGSYATRAPASAQLLTISELMAAIVGTPRDRASNTTFGNPSNLELEMNIVELSSNSETWCVGAKKQTFPSNYKTFLRYFKNILYINYFDSDLKSQKMFLKVFFYKS